MSTTQPCIITSNPDVSGIGVCLSRFSRKEKKADNFVSGRSESQYT